MARQPRPEAYEPDRFTERPSDVVSPPPPSGLVPLGHSANTSRWLCPGTFSADVTTVYPVGVLAQIACTWRNVVSPLVLLTQPLQPVGVGAELLMFAAVLLDWTNTPPPSGTVPVGHSTCAVDCTPVGASWNGVVTTA